MRVGELFKEYLGHMRQFHGKVMGGEDRMGSYQRFFFVIKKNVLFLEEHEPKRRVVQHMCF